MTYTTTELEPFAVIGIAVTTTNQNGQAQNDIGELWQQFFSRSIMDIIPNKASEDIYCIYTDYESDFNGAYTTLLGCKVTSLQTLPEGFTGITVPASRFRVYKSTGKLPDSVVATWKHIWQTPVERCYLTDFDVYGQRSKDPNNAEVETYLSVP